MNDIGRARRWGRFTHPVSGRALITPIDHGLTLGPIEGLNDLSAIKKWLSSDQLTGVVMHKGMVERLSIAAKVGLMIHLNGAVAIDDPVEPAALALKVRLTSIETAVALGADAVSVHLDMGGQRGSHYLSLLGEVVDEAHAVGLPVLAMLYDKTSGVDPNNLGRQRHFMRAAVEVGADVLKVQSPNELARLPDILDGFSHTPVVFAGGMIKGDAELFALARAVVLHGGAGLCAGRNVFQRPDPIRCLRELSKILHAKIVPAGRDSMSQEQAAARAAEVAL
jgi:fructose-bisphosphate aldolase, class I